MRGRRLALFPLALLAAALLLPAHAHACACCSNEGDYYVSTGRPSEYERSIVQQIRFGQTANLYLTEADAEEMAKGVAHTADKCALRGSLTGGPWRLTFRDGGKTGTL